MLLRAGMDPNVRNGLKNTPLHLAAYFGHEAAVEILLACRTSAAMLPSPFLLRLLPSLLPPPHVITFLLTIFPCSKH